MSSIIGGSTTADPIGDYDEKAWFGESGVPDPASDPIGQALALLGRPSTMGNLETLIAESYKFIRMADDLHDVARYLNDMRLCFIVLTVSGYVGVLCYAILLCIRRSRRSATGGASAVSNNGRVNATGRRAGGGGGGRYPAPTQWSHDYQQQQPDRPDWQPQTTAIIGDGELQSVRSDVAGTNVVFGGMHRNHQRPTPAFMRHGMNHQQMQTRLVGADADGSSAIVKQHPIHHNYQTVPAISINDDDYDVQTAADALLVANVPQLAKDTTIDIERA